MDWRGQILQTYILHISERTLYRRRQEYGILGKYPSISDVELDSVIVNILNATPNAGEKLELVV